MRTLPSPPAQLGESPLLLDPDRLVFVDMLAPAVHGVDLEDGSSEACSVTSGSLPFIGAVVQASDNGLVLIGATAVFHLSAPQGGVVELVTILSDTTHRLNDAAVDSRGRLWVGSTSRAGEAGAGALHLWTPGGAVETLIGGMTLPNGIGWSPDGTTAYVVESADHVILTAKIDESTGRVGTFTSFTKTAGSGEPDGLAVAEDGSIWVAIWDGARVDRYAPDGALIESIVVPVTRPTSCAIGQRELFVTSARHGLAESALAVEPLAGHVLRFPVSVDGAPTWKLAL